MGEVYLGYDEMLEREVAVKTLGAHRRLDPEVKSRFLREARILSRLDHPGICRIHGLAEGEESEVLVLEYIEGRTLRDLASSLPLPELLSIFAQVADALAAAHAEDVVHRDLKPENIMVTPQHRAKVLDFGIARSLYEPAPQRSRPTGGTDRRAVPLDNVAGDADDNLTPLWPQEGERSLESGGGIGTTFTREGAILGTIRYMSPEQARGEPVAQPGDMYSFGVMLHELVTGRHPYGDARGSALLLRAARAETVPISDIDPEISALIDVLENLDPRRRPSAAEAADRLRWILGRPLRVRRRRMRRVVVAAVVAVVLASAGAVIWAGIKARRQVVVAQRFAAQARDIRWMMRAEYLSPPHDLEPARARAKAREVDLKEEMDRLGSIAIGPGELALGQVRLALRDYQAADQHLEAAWKAGVRTPEAAFARGVVLSNLYRIGLKRSRGLSDPEAQQRERTRLESELREPALEMLHRGLDDSTTPPAYIEGLVALIEERWDDGLQAAQRLKTTAPWMYEAQMLEGEIRYDQGGRVSQETYDLEREHGIWIKARDAFREATRVGRSYPPAWQRLCGLEAKILETRLLVSSTGTLKEKDFSRADGVCDQALALEPDSPVVLMALAGLTAIRARVRAAAGDDPTSLFRQAGELSQRAVEIDPSEPAGYLFAGWVSSWLASQQFQSGEDPTAEFERSQGFYDRALQLLPGDTEVIGLRGWGCWIAATHALMTGGDPLGWVDRGLQPTLEVLETHPDSASLLTAAGSLLTIRGRCELARGDRAVETLEQAARAVCTAMDESTVAEDKCSQAEVLRWLATARAAVGEDPTADLETANALLDRALELSAGLADAELERGCVWRIAARWARAAGQPPWRELVRARRALERGLAAAGGDEPTGLLMLALVSLDEVRWRLEDGLPADASLGVAREAAERAAALRPTWGDVHLAMGTSALLEGRCRAGRGVDPTQLYVGAEAELTQALEYAYDDAGVLAVRAEVGLWRARWELDHHRPAAEAIQSGFEDAQAALKLDPKQPQAEAVLRQLRALPDSP